MATPVYGGSFSAPKPEQSFAQKLGGALQGFSAGYQGKGQEFLANQQAQRQAQQQKIMGATIQDALEIRKAIEGNDPSTAMSLLDDRVSLLKNMGEDPSDTIALQNELINGNTRGVLGEIDQFISGAKRMGYLKPTPVDTKNIYQGQLLTQDPITGELISKPVNPNEDYIDPELKSMSLRKIAEGAIRLDNEIDAVATSFNKITGLEPDMRAGNRGSINAAIMNLARLISPGVVTEKDVSQLSGAETPIGLIYNTLQGKGVDIEELLKVYDPSNPETFDVDALMSTARSVTAAAIPAILRGYEDEKARAEAFQAPNAYMRAYFNPESSRMKSMLEIQELVQGASPEPIANENFFANSNELFSKAAAGELEPGKYEYPDPENPGSVIIVDYTGQ